MNAKEAKDLFDEYFCRIEQEERSCFRKDMYKNRIARKKALRDLFSTIRSLASMGHCNTFEAYPALISHQMGKTLIKLGFHVFIEKSDNSFTAYDMKISWRLVL